MENLRYLNQFIPYQNFKMEGLFCLRKLLKQGDYIFKLDIKDAYFSIPPHQSSRKKDQLPEFSQKIPVHVLRMSVSLPQGVENSESMLGYLCQRSGGSSQNNKTVRSYCLNKSSSSANSDKFSTSSTSANESIESNSMLSSDCIRQQQFKGGTSVAEPKYADFRWALPKDGCV